jgi:hypothetical protein
MNSVHKITQADSFLNQLALLNPNFYDRFQHSAPNILSFHMRFNPNPIFLPKISHAFVVSDTRALRSAHMIISHLRTVLWMQSTNYEGSHIVIYSITL